MESSAGFSGSQVRNPDHTGQADDQFSSNLIYRIERARTMTGGQSGAAPAVARGDRWPTAVASLAAGAAFFALWFWLLPRFGFRVEMAGAAHWRELAAVPSVLGFAIALRCVWDFGWTGHGTPAPVAPPKRLVVVGFYGYGGIGTTARAIAAGLPQLVVPTSHDQPDNAIRIRRLGIGDFILPKAYTKARVLEKLDRLMNPAVKDNCQRRAADLAGGQSLEQASGLIEELATAEMGSPRSVA